ncbi:cupin domain-containing protein [Methylocapsa sp. S129]|uniref:cupin domain-containing protein n=1 Tax=Methylocapsa sp. S129 TaxID=1641869 RepID=UPI00131AD06B|nr:cupin domain-containing protein [Methylocapsa sp. S129]
MSEIESFVTRVEDVKPAAWNDQRGRLSFHTLISGESTPSDGLVAGVAIVEPGGALALHSHAQPEIYFVLEGAAIVTIEGVERTVSPGAAVFIPGAARHSVRNAFDKTFRFFYVFPADRFDQIQYNFVDEA